ncbi:hypothetical protein B0T25DRAFT_157179 [Lasiosphaeria hispida]|uniref:DUF7582 domain-containing protein n=1 Tax=Lasiosphaeria hispida TaxID=260671 RepID=A0AAJ0MG53_9PEZI|nr:hypothetical protein B0T25DRAFT_157179 [Lasiosphaeria hispida]
MAPSQSLKDRISSPLEAGASIADAHQLPSRLIAALEYVSKKLSRKSVHITVLVVRRDYQLSTSPLPSPRLFSPLVSPASVSGSAVVSPVGTPLRPAFVASPMSAFKQFVRPNAPAFPTAERIVNVNPDYLRNSTVSPAFSDTSMTSASTVATASTSDSTFSHRLRWPGSPVNYGSVPMTPATPFTVASSATATTDTGSAVSGAFLQSPNQFGIRLVHIGPVGLREERILNQTVEKTTRKFKIGADWLPQVVSPTTLGLPADLIHRSLAQNEVLFFSESLNLLSLDHLYTFRTALQSYARTLSPCRLEDAVDELRRLILANGRQRLRKSSLLGAYRWLDPVSESALADVCRMYSRAYGGLEGESGVENDTDSLPAWPLPNLEVPQPPKKQQQPPPQEPQPPTQTLENSHFQLPVEITASKMDWSDREGDSTTPPPPPPPPLTPPPPPPAWSHSPRQLRITPVGGRWSPGEEKELFDGDIDFDMDEDQIELDAIEAWYREVQLQPVAIHLDVSPVETVILSDDYGEPVSEPEPELEAVLGMEVLPEMDELRRTTPKLVPPPPGRNMVLKLQTTFDKPRRRSIQQVQGGVAEEGGEQVQKEVADSDLASPIGGDEEEEELTARPRSAVVALPLPLVRWNTFSIDSILREEATAILSPQQQQQQLGPATPNGYDDISPITRGEWGFLIGNQHRTAAVEMMM